MFLVLNVNDHGNSNSNIAIDIATTIADNKLYILTKCREIKAGPHELHGPFTLFSTTFSSLFVPHTARSFSLNIEYIYPALFGSASPVVLSMSGEKRHFKFPA